MSRILDHLNVLDRPHRPTPGAAAIASFKEWFHFNLLDDTAGTDTIVNLSTTGDPFTPEGGAANLILLTHCQDAGWRGGIDQHDGIATLLDETAVDLSIGRSRLYWQEGAFQLEAALRDGSLALDCQLVPMAEPMMIWKNTPIGSGHLNWLILPWLTASGTIAIAGQTRSFEGVRAYHDHNWGHWLWGDDFAWEWGFSSRVGLVLDGDVLTFVYDRTTDRQGSAVQEHTLALWKGDTLWRLFTRRSIDDLRIGRFDPEAIDRVPGAMNLSNPGQVLTVPRRIEITARDGVDWLEARYSVEAARQVAIPSDLGFGTVELNETFGRLTLVGHVDGMAIAADARACFEFVR